MLTFGASQGLIQKQKTRKILANGGGVLYQNEG